MISGRGFQVGRAGAECQRQAEIGDRSIHPYPKRLGQRQAALADLDRNFPDCRRADETIGLDSAALAAADSCLVSCWLPISV